jgi:hypothetical protein
MGIKAGSFSLINFADTSTDTHYVVRALRRNQVLSLLYIREQIQKRVQ